MRKEQKQIFLDAISLGTTVIVADIANAVGMNVSSDILVIVATFGALAYVFKYVINVKKILDFFGIRLYQRSRIEYLEAELDKIKKPKK